MSNLKYNMIEELKKYKSLLNDYCIMFFRLDRNEPICYFYYDENEESITFFNAVSIQGRGKPLIPTIWNYNGLKDTIYHIMNINEPRKQGRVRGWDLAYIYYMCLIEEKFGIKGFKEKKGFFPVYIELYWTNVMCAVTPKTKIKQTVDRVEAILNGKEK